MEKENILIRLLKDGHITDEEFKTLYPKDEVFIPYIHVEEQLNPQPLDWYPYPYTPTWVNDRYVTTCSTNAS